MLKTYNYESIKILDSNFSPLIIVGHDATHRDGVFTNLASETQTQMNNGLYLSNAFSEEGSIAQVFFSLPLNQNGQNLGYLIYEVDIDQFFQDTLFEQKLTETGETIISQKIETDTYIINDLRHDDAPVLSYRIDPNSDWARPALESAQGISGYGITKDYRGEKILAAWDYSPITRWGMVAKIDYSEALTPLETRISEVAYTTIVLTVSSIIGGYILSRQFTIPLKKIQS